MTDTGEDDSATGEPDETRFTDPVDSENSAERASRPETGPSERHSEQPNGGVNRSPVTAPHQRQSRTAPDTAGGLSLPAESGDRQPSQSVPAETGDETEPSWWVLLCRDLLVTVVAVALLGGYLFAISGVWPPMVAIESGSMEPHMNINDMVFVMNEQRFEPPQAHGETGVVTATAGVRTGYRQYEGYGDVIVFEPGGSEQKTPIIHRAMMWVEEGENWYRRANESHLGAANSCADLEMCPAPHAGFITKGDNNSRYDQAGIVGGKEPVRPDWIVGTAEVRIPKAGWFRLRLTGENSPPGPRG